MHSRLWHCCIRSLHALQPAHIYIFVGYRHDEIILVGLALYVLDALLVAAWA